MAWKTIQGRRYLYRSVRIDGRPTTIYVGRGPQAEEQDRRHQEQRRSLTAQREETACAVVTATKTLALVRSAAKDIDLFVRASLVAAGYYQHARGRWRIRRFTDAT